MSSNHFVIESVRAIFSLSVWLLFGLCPCNTKRWKKHFQGFLYHLCQTSNVKTMSVHLWCWFSWVGWRMSLRWRTDLLPSAPMCVQCCPPNVSCLLECVGVAVSDLCACVEVALRVWLCPELQVCQYLSLSSSHVMAVSRSLGPLTLLLSSVSALQQPLTVCVCLFPQLKEMCRRELDKSESEIKKNGSIIGEYKQVCTVYIWNLCFRIEYRNREVKPWTVTYPTQFPWNVFGLHYWWFSV